VEKVAAGWMGRSFARDIDLSLPDRPRIIPELLRAPLGEDGLLFFGGEHSQVLRGRSVRTLLPRVLPLLDGTRTIRDVAEAAGIPLRHARDVVSLLASRDLLEDGACAPGTDRAPVRSFLGRFLNVSGVDRNRDRAFERLASTRIRVDSPTPLRDALVTQLHDAGVRDVVGGDDAGPPADLAVLVTTGDQADPGAQCARAWDRGERTLLVRLGADEAQVGPFIQRGESICPGCLERVHPHPRSAPEGELARYLVALAGAQVVTLASKIAMGGSQRGLRVFRTDPRLGLVTDLRVAPRMPGCARCGVKGTALNHDDPLLLPWLYHSGTILETRELLAPKDYQGHYAVTNLKLAFEEDVSLPGAPAVALPPREPLRVEPFWSMSRKPRAIGLDLRAMNALLAWSAGEMEDGGAPRRILPSGGNLGSVNLWLVVRRVSGLEPAVYHYRARTHELVRWAGPLADAELARALRVDASQLPAAVVAGTGAFRKVMKKYQAFGYRLCFLDAGVALSYLHTVGDALGLELVEYPDMDDPRVLGAIGVPPRWENPIATFALGVDELPMDPGGALAWPRAPLPPALTSDDYSPEVLKRLFEHGGLAHGPAPRAAPRDWRGPRMPPKLEDLGEILTTRRSVRRWLREPVPGAELHQVAALALEGMRRRLARGGPPCFVRPVLAVARGDAALPEGLYDLAEDGSALRRRCAFDVPMMKSIMFQSALAKAPAAVIFVGDLDRALAERGLRGYREMAQYAGTGAGLGWIAAASHGIGAVTAGGLMTVALRRVAGVDGYTECPILTLNLGVPRPPPGVG
jgi:SagB-type dehydrogenase family enzyme